MNSSVLLFCWSSHPYYCMLRSSVRDHESWVVRCGIVDTKKLFAVADSFIPHAMSFIESRKFHVTKTRVNRAIVHHFRERFSMDFLRRFQ
jgi:hypothetical protein